MTENFQLVAYYRPQLGKPEFRTPVKSVREAITILNLLDRYDETVDMRRHTREHGLRIFLADEWWEWTDPETGDTIHDLMRKRLTGNPLEAGRDSMDTFGAFDACLIDEEEKRDQQDEHSRLTNKLNSFCDANGLPHECAAELLCRLCNEEPRRSDLCQWLQNFIEEWEAAA